MNVRRFAASVFAAACAWALLAGPTPTLAIPHADTPDSADVHNILVASGTLVKVAMLQTISSAHSRAGDKFTYRVVDNVMAGDRVAIPAGTQGSGKVLESRPAHGGRVDGHLRVQFDPLVLADGTKVSLAITTQSLVADQNERNGTAGAVAEIADMTVPGFFILDFLRKGDDVTLAANAPFHIAVTEDAFLSE